MASKQKERVGEVQREKGKLYDVVDGKYKLLKHGYTTEELRLLLRTLGKRAQTRIKTLSRYFDERGRKYTGQINPIFERYRDYDVKYTGLSNQALYQKVKTAIDILNAKQSTYTGYRNLQIKAYNSLKASHPKLKDLTFEEWEVRAKYMGAWQSAHEGQQYDSETLLSNANWAYSQGNGFVIPDVEEVDLDKWFLDIQREGSSGKWLELKEDFDDI